ncbi:MAG: pyridine nucleotide-disulfide oxidoreductase [endosymbiont of Galathealinum brachiosum]|uniref:Pyridine nucleotide-disulfide oxidoreductase n=1 Tax=endosymbiont of Galathealinum brachiosum TaxID=2200906 RepID=A0A370DME1_9GAMM|nr:MAG: pyridine nucleotide-disulfide oxidoreductase [endosymbiont of Galathealinum brachiosum]
MAVTQTHIETLNKKLNKNSSTLPMLNNLILKSFKFLYAHMFIIGLLITIIFGWSQRDNNYLSAETGTGYLLGIVGGSMMLILLLYPLSKRLKVLTRWIPIRYWFGIHMLFGIIGPTLILFHSNFQLGSTNSSIALFSMLLVAASGLIGRYIYTHIHHGLYGTRITLKELKLDTENNHTHLLSMVNMDDVLDSQLKIMEEKALKPYTGILASFMDVIYLGVNAKHLLVKIIYSLKNNQPADKKMVIDSVNRYTLALRHIAAFKLYERLFSLWHILHLPLFIMMIITAVIHIFAVHIY